MWCSQGSVLRFSQCLMSIYLFVKFWNLDLKLSLKTLALALSLVHIAFNRMHPNRRSCLNLSANGSTGDIQIHMVLPKLGIQFRMVPLKVPDSICSHYISTFTCQQQERRTSLCSEVTFNLSSKNSPKQGSPCS